MKLLIYQRSERLYPDVLPEIVCPVSFVTRPIKKAEQFFWNGERIYAHRVLNGESIGLEQMTPRYWRVWFGLGIQYAPRVRSAEGGRTHFQ